MIEIVNQKQQLFDPVLGVNVQGLTIDQRKSIFQRALHATPFFNVFDFFDAAHKKLALSSKIGINKDFYITEIVSNSSDVFDASGAFSYNIYSAYTGKSLFGIGSSTLLPAPLLGFDGGSPVANGLTPDTTQREVIPRLVKTGDYILASIQSVNAIDAAHAPVIMTAGFNINQYPYLDDLGMEKVNDSLNKDTEYEIFKVDFDAWSGDGSHPSQAQTLQLTNDNKPRLILACGMAYVGNVPLATSTIQIQDLSRLLKWSNAPMPLPFIAPTQPTAARNSTVQTHGYWLPIEYYFQPFGDLQLKLESTLSDPLDGGAVPKLQIQFLTRTV